MLKELSTSLDLLEQKIDSIEKMYQTDISSRVLYNQLISIPLNNSIILAPGVLAWKVYQSETQQIWSTIMYPGCHINLHDHDGVEIIKVVKGECVDKYSNLIINSSKDYIIPPNTLHLISNDTTDVVILTIIFKPPI